MDKERVAFVAEVPSITIDQGIVIVEGRALREAWRTSTFRAFLDLGASELAKWDGLQKPPRIFPRVVS